MSLREISAPGRWTLAAGLLLTSLICLYTGVYEQCIEKTVGGALERTCSPPSVTDAATIATAFAIVMLIAPELGEIGLLGISVKQRLAVVETVTDATAQRSESLERQLVQQSARLDAVSISASNASAQANTFIVTSSEIQHSLQNLSPKESAFATGKPLPKRSSQPRTYSSSYFEQVGRLIANWEALTSALDLRYGRTRVELTVGEEDTRKRFLSLFGEELNIVRAARNTVAHAGDLPDEDLSSALAISERLLEILRGA